jgi:Holliday junction DNA helicase RuvA
MIGYLKGEILSLDDKSIVLDVNNVGYEVNLSLSTLLKYKVGEEIELYIHSHIREDQFTLFGFENKSEKDLFRKLTSVSGVGPRSGLTMLSVSTPENLVRAIEGGNIDLFPKIPGVGKKTLEKVILELRGKFDNMAITSESEAMKNARMALETLGYNGRDISTTLATLHPDLDMNSLIKESLKILSKV